MTTNAPTLPRVLSLEPLTVDGYTLEHYLLPDGTRVVRGTVADAYVAVDWRDPARCYGLARRGMCQILTGPIVGGVDAAIRHMLRIALRVDAMSGLPDMYGSDPR